MFVKKNKTKRLDEIMAYKYDSALKHFTYSKERYKIISDFLLSGDITNPNIMLNVTKISKEFGKIPKNWFVLPTTTSFVKALIQVKLEDGDKKLKKAFFKFLNNENIMSDSIISTITQNTDLIVVLNNLNYKQLQKLMKEIGLISVKRGNLKGSKNGKSIQGTWLHKDLAVKYAEWLDPKFSIWISQKIFELVNDGVSWNEIRATTKMDYKPLIIAIEKYVMPKYSSLDENIVKGKIANYINLRVIGQKAKDIRTEKGIEPHELTRDFFTKPELNQIEQVQIYTEILISQLDIYDFKTLEQKICKYKF